MADPLPVVVPAIAPQPETVPWPTDAWPTGPASGAVDDVVARAFDDASLAATLAVVVVQHGLLIAERYAGELPSFTHPPTPVTETTTLHSWSMAKSVLHAAVGLLVADGVLELDAPAPVAAWREPGDPRRAITLRQLLQMRDGLSWREDYVDAQGSDTIEMLFGSGANDVVAYATAKHLLAPPGTRFAYSSGTSNIIAGILASVVGPGDETATFLRDRLFGPIGMDDASVRCDAAGTFIASSYCYATARSYARFGTLYLRGGEWAGRRILERAWVDDAQVAISRDDETPSTYYSHHWWLDGAGTYWAAGYEGQRIIVSPRHDAVIVRIGRTPAAGYPALRSWCADAVDALGSA